MRRRSHRDAPRTAPAAELEAVFDGLPALAGLGRTRPVVTREQTLDQALHVGRLAQAQQVGFVALLAHVDDVFVAVTAVPAHQCRAVLAKLVEQPAQGALAWPEAVLLAGAELRVEHQAQVAHPEGVQHVAGAPRLVWVVAHLGTLLVAVQWLDRRVEVQHPWAIQRVAHAVHQRLAHPRLGGRGLHRLERATHRVFADQPLQTPAPARPRRHRARRQCGRSACCPPGCPASACPARPEDSTHWGCCSAAGTHRPSGRTHQRWPGTRQRTQSARAAWPGPSRPSAHACARPSCPPPSRLRWLASARFSSAR